MLPSALAAACLLAAGAAAAQSPGEQGFIDNCAACHQKAGEGIPGAFPALAGDPLVLGDPTAVATTMLLGRGGMPAFKDGLSDAELADIATYVRGAWGNRAAPIPAVTFAQVRSGPPPQTRLQAH